MENCPNTTGVSPENAGIDCGLVPHTTLANPCKKIDTPMVMTIIVSCDSFFKGLMTNLSMTRDTNTAEVDFVFSDGRRVIPVEAKASENVQAQSLKVYRAKYDTVLAVRTSLANLRFDNGLLNIPLYVLWNFENYKALLNSDCVKN